MEEILEEFVDFLENCGEDAFYVFDNTEEAIKKVYRSTRLNTINTEFNC